MAVVLRNGKADTVPQLIDSDQLGAMLGGVPTGTLAQWRHLGKGPRFLKIGRHVRYDLEDVNAWLAEQKRNSTS